ncbi:MAG: universal stress protein [Acidimicrobiales bacterium]|nr:universal stress protein [Acidimicrobiales bacterium]
MTSDTSGPPPPPRVKHVLVPLDGSKLALQAMPTARVLADRFGAELQSVSVAGAEDEVDHLRSMAAAALNVDFGSDRAWVVAGEDAADEIVRRSESLGSCLVCMTTRGRGRLHGAIVGSVARSVLQRSGEAVVALGPMADNPGWSPRPRSWPEPLSVSRIVACVDGSDTSEQVLPLAAAWAQGLGMSLSILTVTDDQPRSDELGPRSRYGPSGEVDVYIAELVQRWSAAVSDVDGVVVRDPIGLASGIRAHLDARPTGLIALSTHARSGLQRVRLGAAAAKIVHASVAPCLVVPIGP